MFPLVKEDNFTMRAMSNIGRKTDTLTGLEFTVFVLVLSVWCDFEIKL